MNSARSLECLHLEREKKGKMEKDRREEEEKVEEWREEEKKRDEESPKASKVKGVG